ncbi:MAG: hypothetical protein KA953_00530 [Lachnospiraceae bacterium]|nr:hypothetical protein [Lachnospiraceae bacterium]
MAYYSTAWIKANNIIQISTDNGTTWTSLPDPKALKIGAYDLDSSKSGRGQDGNAFRDRVAVKEKLFYTGPEILRTDYSKILALTSNASFLVKYYSDKYNAVRTVLMYVGDRQEEIDYGYLVNDPAHSRIKEFTIDFIEL